MLIVRANVVILVQSLLQTCDLFLDPVDTDDSLVFSEVKMNPSELSTILRRRRDVKANDQSNQRRKRALSSYDLYDTDGVGSSEIRDPFHS